VGEVSGPELEGGATDRLAEDNQVGGSALAGTLCARRLGQPFIICMYVLD
jgi:hypothetical protein